MAQNSVEHKLDCIRKGYTYLTFSPFKVWKNAKLFQSTYLMSHIYCWRRTARGVVLSFRTGGGVSNIKGVVGTDGDTWWGIKNVVGFNSRGGCQRCQLLCVEYEVCTFIDCHFRLWCLISCDNGLLMHILLNSYK